MKNPTPAIATRWLRLAHSIATLLCSGVIYAWSILKAPLADSFGWNPTQLALNYTLMMCFFGVGILSAGLLESKTTARQRLLLSAVLVAAGFISSSRISGTSIIPLYLCYGVCSGFGIGLAYNTILPLTNSWFPDRKGLSSGCLAMSFAFSALLVGKVVDKLVNAPNVGWQNAYLGLGLCLGAVLLVAALVMKYPPAGTKFPPVAPTSSNAAVPDVSTGQMLRRSAFWTLLLYNFTLAAMGNTVISFAKDFSLSVGAAESLAVTLVGLLSICNGAGRLTAGWLFDAWGIMTTKATASAVAITATACGLAAAATHTLWLGALAVCLCGFGYGFCATICASFIAALFGVKHFALNFGMLNLLIIPNTFVATLAGALLTTSDGYTGPFALILGVSLVGLVFNLMIKKPPVVTER